LSIWLLLVGAGVVVLSFIPVVAVLVGSGPARGSL
jgi:hypothetical protein